VLLGTAIFIDYYRLSSSLSHLRRFSHRRTEKCWQLKNRLI